MRNLPTATPSSINSVTAAAFRAGLTNAGEIRSTMADDLRELLAAHGGVTEEDLQVRGWTGRQITLHATKARELAHRHSAKRAS